MGQSGRCGVSGMGEGGVMCVAVEKLWRSFLFYITGGRNRAKQMKKGGGPANRFSSVAI